jgi:hypothetical protein
MLLHFINDKKITTLKESIFLSLLFLAVRRLSSLQSFTVQIVNMNVT